MLGRLGQLARAPFGLSKAARARPEVVRGFALLHMGRDERAIECFDTVLRVNPRHPVALMDKGVLFSRRGQPEDALLLFNRALEADPSFALAAFNRASALFSLERFEEAIDVYNIALRRRPDLPDAWYF